MQTALTLIHILTQKLTFRLTAELKTNLRLQSAVYTLRGRDALLFFRVEREGNLSHRVAVYNANYRLELNFSKRIGLVLGLEYI